MIRLLVALLVACCAFAQDLALKRLKQELKVAQEQDQSEEEVAQRTGNWDSHRAHQAERIMRLHALLLGWIEQQLPKGPSAAAIKSSDWESKIEKLLSPTARDEKAVATQPDSTDDNSPSLGSLGVHLVWKEELPEILFVVATVGVPCGGDQAVYGYRFDSNGSARVISNHPSGTGYGAVAFDISDAEFQGQRLLLIRQYSSQCQSTWMGTTYSVFRVSGGAGTPAVSLLAGEHGFWMGNNDDGLLYLLKPNELIIELLDRSIDGGVHNRTQIHRISFTDGMKRNEPVALQPQDFAEEWLTRPWGEMSLLSSAETQKWHSKLADETLSGEYLSVIPCTGKPDRWSIGFQITDVKYKPLPQPIDVYLMVRELGNYRYSMEAVSDSPFKECPGEGQPSEDHPWLSREQLKALP